MDLIRDYKTGETSDIPILLFLPLLPSLPLLTLLPPLSLLVDAIAVIAANDAADNAANDAAVTVVAAIAAVTDLQDKQSIFKESVFKSISNNQSGEFARLNTLTSNIFCDSSLFFELNTLSPMMPIETFQPTMSITTFQHPDIIWINNKKAIPNQHNIQKGQEDSTVSFSPTCDQPSLPHH